MSFQIDIEEPAARKLVDVLQEENDIVRIVEPQSRKVLYWPAVDNGEVDCPCFECNAVWGRADRCPNCSSLAAIETMQRMFKMELNGNRAFWVQSRPLVMGGVPCVIETVNDVTDGLMVEGADHGAVAGLIDSLNGLIVTDALTGLFNRRFLDDFTRRLAELAREGVRVNVAMLDLDDMKDINDSHGHPAGDAVLKDVSGFLKLNFNAKSAGCEQYAVRYGGDEFLVIDIGSDFGGFAREVHGRYENMRRTCYFGETDIPFSLSIGMASSDEFGWNWDALLDAADQHMYLEKRARDRKVTLPVHA